MDISKINGAAQDSAKFYIPIPSGLSAEGIAVFILLQILSRLAGNLCTASNKKLITNSGKNLTFDNSKRYPEMPLFIWRQQLKGNFHECQIVFIKKDIYID